jgi:hypothetical protein
MVKKFADISPSRVRMTGQAGQEIKSKVTIVPLADYPFKVLDIQTAKKDNIRVEMETVQQAQGSQYVLTVVNMKEEKGRYSDNIILKTDSPLKPELKIHVYGNIFAPKSEAEKKG